MNFLKDSLNQFRDAFLAMPVPSRVIAGILVAAIVIGLGFLMKGGSSSEGTYLFGGQSFSEQELGEMELAFSQAKLTGWKREGMRLRVPSSSQHEYLNALAEAGTLPTRLHSAMEEALNQSGLMELNSKQRARWMHGKKVDCSRDIEAFPDVQWARVEYDIREGGFSGDVRQTASVTIVPEGTRPLSTMRKKMIREHVAGCFAGLKEEDVHVSDTNEQGGLYDEDEHPLLATQRRVESKFDAQIRKLLVGYGDFQLAVRAEINPSLGSEKVEVKYDPEAVITESSSRKREFDSLREPQGGVPGAVPNTATSSNTAMKIDEISTKVTSSDESKESRSEVGQSHEQSRLVGLQTERVTVSIGLPLSYYETAWRRQYLTQNADANSEEIPSMTAEQLEQLKSQTSLTIKNAVTSILPPVEVGASKMPLVEVWDYPDLPESRLAAPSTSAKAFSWLAGSWQAVGLVVLALIALLIARSVAKSSPTASPQPFEEGFGLEVPTPQNSEEEASDEAGKKKNEMEITGASITEELTGLIDSNPDVAANVLRSWMGQAA